MDGLRISGDLPELHLDLQINHEAGRALVSLVTLGLVSGILQQLSHSQHHEGQLEQSGNPFPIAWPSF